MNFMRDLLMRITRTVNSSKEAAGMTSIVIRKSYAYLENELRSTFKDQKDVKVIVDSRKAERRQSRQAVKFERRLADRRCQKEELVEVVISI